MKGRDLERALGLADELVEVRARLDRMRALEEQLGHEADVEQRAPQVASAAAARVPSIERITRSLEEQWVAQGPLVSIWQRAVELAELAESAGADSGPLRADVQDARHRVEAARLETHDHLDALCREREALMDIALAAPFELPSVDAVHDDPRPEAARRDGLALAAFAREIERAAGEAGAAARDAITQLRAELASLGDRGALETRAAELEADLPARVELPASAPPSAAMRLRRAGVEVTNGAIV
jgi:hypothetical protein